MKSINPSCKLIGLLTPTLLLAALHKPYLNLCVFALCVALLLLSRVRLRSLGTMLAPVLLTAAGMFFTGLRFQGRSAPVNSAALHLQGSGFWNGLTLSSRVLAFAGLGLLFVLTTDRITLIRSLSQQLRLPPVFAYGLLAAFGMLPHMAMEYRRTRAAFRARGLRAPALSPALLRPLLVKSVRWSEALSIAMESKGLSEDDPRTVYEPLTLRLWDRLFPVCTAVLFAALALAF